MAPRHDDARVAAVIGLFEALQPADLSRLDTFYTPDATFKDPFNEVCGVPAIRAVFEHLNPRIGAWLAPPTAHRIRPSPTFR